MTKKCKQSHRLEPTDKQGRLTEKRQQADRQTDRNKRETDIQTAIAVSVRVVVFDLSIEK